MAAPAMRYYLRRLNDPAVPDRRDDLPRLQRHLLDSSCVFMLLGALILTQQLAATAAAAPGDVEHVLFAAFAVWLLGAAFGMLSVVAPQFPRLAAAAARALRGYMLGL